MDLCLFLRCAVHAFKSPSLGYFKFALSTVRLVHRTSPTIIITTQDPSEAIEATRLQFSGRIHACVDYIQSRQFLFPNRCRQYMMELVHKNNRFSYVRQSSSPSRKLMDPAKAQTNNRVPKSRPRPRKKSTRGNTGAAKNNKSLRVEISGVRES